MILIVNLNIVQGKPSTSPPSRHYTTHLNGDEDSDNLLDQNFHGPWFQFPNVTIKNV